MRLIAHRGNTSLEVCENSPSVIENRISDGFEVEIDLWKIGSSWFLGHDSPTYEITKEFLFTYRKSLWIHCKNTASLISMSTSNNRDTPLNYFWHQDDFYTVTSAGFVWAHPKAGVITNASNTVLVLPSYSSVSDALSNGQDIFAICSDEPDLFL